MTNEDTQGVCPVHDIKCAEWKATDEKVTDVQKSKLSIKMFQVVIGIFLTLGGAYWYNEDRQAREYFASLMDVQNESTKALSKHIRVSNIILKNMSHDVREVKMNQERVLKQLKLDYQEIPGYYGPEDDMSD